MAAEETTTAGGYAADEQEVVVKVDNVEKKAIPRSAQRAIYDGVTVGEEITLLYAVTVVENGKTCWQYFCSRVRVIKKTERSVDVVDLHTEIEIHLPCRCHEQSQQVVIAINRGVSLKQQRAYEATRVIKDLQGQPDPLKLDSIAEFLRAGEWRLVIARIKEVLGLQVRPLTMRTGASEVVRSNVGANPRSDLMRSHHTEMMEANLLSLARDVSKLRANQPVSDLYAGDASRRHFAQKAIDGAALFQLDSLKAPTSGYLKAMADDADRSTAFDAAVRSAKP